VWPTDHTANWRDWLAARNRGRWPGFADDE
jgi:hypothetical protein